MVTGRIFLSHSKHDEEIINYFTKAFARVKIGIKLMELENLSQRYAGVEISDSIRYECNAVAVLLGKKLANPPYESRQYTHNWVNFEVGVARGSGKPVWVFESFGETIPFPIPHVTDYVKYDVKNMEHLRTIGKLVGDNPFERSYTGKRIQCPYETCNAAFWYWSSDEKINCPVCRKPFTIGNPQVKQGIDTSFTYFPSNIR